MKLPDEYKNYMASSKPKQGEITIDPGWFQLWPSDKLEEYNRGYEIENFAPGYVGFGSNGGDEILAFDPNGRIVMMPFIPMRASHAIAIAQTWGEFEKTIKS